MAAGARRARLPAQTVGLAITGIAGPDRAPSISPSASIHHIAAETDWATRVTRRVFSGDRDRVRLGSPWPWLSRWSGAFCWACRRCERDRHRAGIRRDRARAAAARGYRRAAGRPPAAARRRPPGAARGHPPHAALPRRHLTGPGRHAAASARSRRGRPLALPAEARRRSGSVPFPNERPPCPVAGAGCACRPSSTCSTPASGQHGRPASRRRNTPSRAHLTLGRWRERAARAQTAIRRSGHDTPRHRPAPQRPAARRRRLHPARALPLGRPAVRL